MKLTQPQITYLKAVENGEIVSRFSIQTQRPERYMRIKNSREERAPRATIESLRKKGLIFRPGKKMGSSDDVKWQLTEQGQSELARIK